MAEATTATTGGKTAKQGGVMLIVALMAGYSVVYMDKSMISTAIIPISQHFHLDSGQTGLIMSAFFLGYSLMQIPGGWLADKFGAKRVLMVSVLVIAAFAFLFGAMSGLILFMVMRFFAGMGHGGYPPSCTKSVAENFPQKRRTFVQSLILSTSGIGGILAYTLGAHMVTANWRMAYDVLGVFYLIAFVLIAIFVPSHKGEAARAAKAKAEAKAGNTTAAEADAPKVGFKDVITNPNVLVLFVAMLLLNLVLYGNMSWLPSYITKTFGLTINQASWLLALNSVFGTVATIFAGSLLSKLFLGREKLAVGGSCVVVAVLIVAFVMSHNLVLSLILLILISMVSTLAFTGIFTWPHKIMRAEIIGSSIGVINTGGTLGGFLSPMIIGQLIKASGGSFTTAFLFLAAAGVACALVVLLVKVPKKA
ncbi:MFS transporter [Bifidobacterium sp. ESL0790]|uniref:MFS transporter n=1 Tax=Bifidobacterium sp. ESL0790 TaxID=2983233 RepID=UPI0023F6C556|nr:MFS transporter [Bifidobacterium sp. ESL0790]WEV73015.1 MFS transporter [Bifidobacterium sp. ESL0790]